MSTERLCIESPRDHEWFRAVVEESKARLRALPEDSRPRWIREHPESLVSQPSERESA